MNPRYAQVAERAAHRCEYCHAPEAIFNFPFEVEHIVPRSRDGGDDMSNWALSCRACNLRKGNQIEAADPLTNSMLPLFHPRRDRWEDHFRFDETNVELMGLSAIGRATVACLQMNQPAQLTARRQWIRLKIFPTL
jgi:hypothetical protein